MYGEITLHIEMISHADGTISVRGLKNEVTFCQSIEEAIVNARLMAHNIVEAQIKNIQMEAEFEAAHAEAELEFPGTSDDPKDILAMLDGE